MWPWLVCLDVCATGESEVDGVEGYDEIFGIVYLFKGIDDTRLTSDIPSELLVWHAVSRAHSLLVDDG